MNSKELKNLCESYSQVYSESGYFPTKESQKADEKKYRMGYTPVKHRTVQTQSKPPVKEDTFDAIKGHLIDEGYAETEEAALAIMANMSEEWRQSIVEAIGGPIGNALKAYSNATRPLFKGLPQGTFTTKDNAFKAGGGNAKMKATGMGRSEVEKLGVKNLRNQP